MFWYEAYDSIIEAIQREKSLKKYKREWKINLIERDNPFWDDLYPGLFQLNEWRPDGLIDLPPGWPVDDR